MKTYTILEHHEKGYDCDGDYFDIEVLDGDGKVVASYDDYYHDKGQEKASGFIDGVRFATGEKIEVKYRSIADREVY